MVKLRRCNEAQLSLFNKPLPLDLHHNNTEVEPEVTQVEEPETNNNVYSREYANRAKQLRTLKGQELLDAVKEGDIFWGRWGYNRTITNWFIVKRKTAKRIILHEIDYTHGNQPGDSIGGWTTCPILPPKEISGKRDMQGIPLPENRYAQIQIPDYPKSLTVWDGTYGWENMD